MYTECDVTIYIPTRNSVCTFSPVLSRLRMQTLRPVVFVVDSGSIDGTKEAVQRQIESGVQGGLDLNLLEVPGPDRLKAYSICKVRHFCSEHCKTKILMFIDSDVLLPPDIIGPMLKQLDDNPKIGMLGIRYDPRTNHVKMGATMILAQLAKEHKWRMTDNACECINFSKDIFSLDWLTFHVPDQTARHMLRF